MLIGFTGKRHVGKSFAAGVLREAGFIPTHTFAPGKAAAEAYFVHIGATREQAREMVHGRLRDVPSSLLPGNAKPRSFLEELGYWWGGHMGPEWTLGVELNRLYDVYPYANVVVESVVYEAPLFKHRGGRVVRLIRPTIEDNADAARTNRAEADIVADVTIINDGSLEDLRRKVLALI